MIIKAKIYPNCRSQNITFKDGLYKIHLANIPEKQKANKELIKLLAQNFKTSKNKVNIISGKKSRQKLIDIKL